MIKSQNKRSQNQKVNHCPLPLIHHVNSGSQLILVVHQLEGIEDFVINRGILGRWFVNKVAYMIFW